MFRLKFTILLFVIIGLSSAYGVDEKLKPPGVFVTKVKAIDLFDVMSYPARVTSKINTNLLAETDGIVTRILTPLGQRVKRGQKLMMITHTDPIYQYAPASVTSPVSGVVSVLLITEGSQVAAGQKLASITDPTQTRITVELPALDLPSITQGLKGEFKIPGKDGTIAVHVRGVSPFVDAATGTATCEIEMDEPTTQLLPGLIGQVSFKTNLRKGFSIPEHAITYKGDNPFVRLVEDGKAKRVAVRLGNRQRGSVEITNGLSEDNTLIERTSRFVSDGEAVTIEEAAK